MTSRSCLALGALALIVSVSALASADPLAKAAVGAGAVNAVGAASAGAKGAGVHVSTVNLPKSVHERMRAVLRDSVEQNLSAADVGGHSGYAVAVSLLQLRRYIGPDDNEPRMICIVDLALHDEHGVLVGSVRGRASAAHAEARDALDAAAHSAVLRIPEALRLVEQTRTQSRATAAYARR